MYIEGKVSGLKFSPDKSKLFVSTIVKDGINFYDFDYNNLGR